MHLCVLIESHFGPIPDGITIEQKFGSEVIVDEDGKCLAEGSSMLLSGEPELFTNWLRSFTGVWISDNPAFGEWRVVHVKDEE